MMKGVNIFQLQCLLLCFMITYCAHQSTAKVAKYEVLTVVLLSKEGFWDVMLWQWMRGS